MTPSRHRWRLTRLVIVASLLAIAILAVNRAGTSLVVSVPLENPEAILVLGSHEWERFPDAITLANTYPSALVFLTQPRVPTIYNCHDCQGRRARLIASGLAEQRIVMLPYRVSNTRDEVAAAKAECEKRRIRRLLVVTSPYHTRRALDTLQLGFAETGVAIGVVPAKASPARPDRWWSAAYDRAYVRYEWAAIAYHAVRDAMGMS